MRFAVDLDACTGCKACVTACHSLNGLDDDETWRDVGVFSEERSLIRSNRRLPRRAITAWIQPVSMAVRSMPTTKIRYRHRAASGRPMHRLPILHSEMSVRRAEVFEEKRHRPQMRHVLQPAGVGEAPACVQACPNEAIRITIVDQQQVSLDRKRTNFLPGSPTHLIRCRRPNTELRENCPPICPPVICIRKSRNTHTCRWWLCWS